MTNLPFTIFGREINIEPPRIRKGGRPRVTMLGHPIAEGSHQLEGIKTTFAKDGSVMLAGRTVVGKAWALHSFLPTELDICTVSGTWLVFDDDIQFRAGDGVWLTNTAYITNPGIMFE
jgi:hypothetical protein